MHLSFHLQGCKKANMHQDALLDLSSLRVSLGLRLADSARIAQLSIPTIRQLETGKGNIGSLQAYLSALRLRLHWIGVDGVNNGATLSERRKKQGLSQRALAAKIEVNHRTIIALENEFRGRVDTLMQVLAALRLNPSIRGIDENTGNDGTAFAVDEAIRPVIEPGPTQGLRTTLIQADALEALRQMPSAIVDCVMTSPPYWQQRSYAAGGIGEEQTVDAYLMGLRAVFKQAHRVLKPRGSLWINIDDTYHQRSMQGVPWRLTLGLIEDSGWLVRNDVIWHKSGGALNRADNRLTHRHEHLFHLVKQEDYYFDADAIRGEPLLARLNGAEIATATGLTLETCLHRIAAAKELTNDERCAVSDAVHSIFDDVAAGRLHDFRMVLRGGRVTHSDSPQTSARASRLDDQGFYILKYDPRGSLPGDVWDLAPDRTKGRDTHYAAYPTSLCERPILSTCPINGVVLDPFVGSGTTLVAAQQLGRRGIGIDLSSKYLNIASERLKRMAPDA